MPYLQRKKALCRRTSLKNRKSLNRRGKKTKIEQPIKKALLDQYFKTYGWEEGGERWARCQICGKPMHRRDANACHKKRASQTGKCIPLNILAAHGFQWRPANCHSWADSKASRYGPMETDPACVDNGGIVEWGQDQKQNLDNYLAGQPDRLNAS